MRFSVLLSLVLLSLICAAGLAAGGELDVLPLGDPVRAFSLGSGHSGEIVDTATGEVVSLEETARKMASARVVLIGESHTHLAQKNFQAELFAALADVQPNLVLGMEFFRREDAPILERWVSGELDGEDFLRESGWYDRGTYRWGYYDPIMQEARRRSIPVVGVNVPREIPRAVNRKGLDGLSDEQKAVVGEVNVDASPGHRYLISRYFGDTVAMMPQQWLDNMYAAQCLWDTVMARSILDALPEDGTLVLIVGSGHVAYDLGIERRIHDELVARGEPDIEVATFCPVEAPIPDPESEEPTGHPMGGDREGETGSPAIFVRSLADFVGVFDSNGGVEAWPTFGLRLKQDDGEPPKVSMVWPDTRAADAGFSAGDVILDVNGATPNDLADLRLMLAQFEWGDRADVRVSRGEEEMNVAMLLIPEPVSVDKEVAPGWAVEPAAAFEPSGTGPVEIVDEGEVAETVVLSRNDQPEWVVVREGDAILEAHELDGNGRVVRSLYLAPQADGAVEVLYARDAIGNVTNTERRDRTGAVR